MTGCAVLFPILIGFQPAKFPSPTIVRDLRHTNRADRSRDRLPLRNKNIHLPQLGDNLLRLALLPRHIQPSFSCQKTYLGMDRFIGGWIRLAQLNGDNPIQQTNWISSRFMGGNSFG